jgi:hypothetical protein
MADATSAPRSGTLNIISHGTKAILLGGTVRYIIPDVADYTIVAGTFLSEQPLKKGARYRLHGVKPASGPAARVSTGANIFLVGVSLQPNAAVFCELDLPIPASFRSVRCTDVGAGWFPTPPPTLQFAAEIALVHVLSYEFDDAAALAILDQDNAKFPWEPKVDGTTKTVNFHIYSDPAAAAPPGNIPAFTTLTNLFGQNVPLDLAAVGPFVPPATVYPEIRGLEQPLELQEYSNSRPQPPAKEPPYSCATLVALPPVHAASRAFVASTPAAPGSLGFSVSVKGD